MLNVQKNKLPKICVYKITSPSKKVYIGSTINLKERMASYRRLECPQQYKLLNSFRKYGFEKHKVEVLCECELADVRQKEAYYGQLFSALGENGLNLRLPKHGEGFVCVSEKWRIENGIRKKGNTYTLGKKYGSEVKKRMSEAQKNRKRDPHTESTKIKMSESAMGGKNHKAVILLNIETGVFYECFKDASASIGKNYNSFRSSMYKKREKRFIVA